MNGSLSYVKVTFNLIDQEFGFKNSLIWFTLSFTVSQNVLVTLRACIPLAFGYHQKRYGLPF